MNNQIKKLAEEAKKLSPQEQAELVEDILQNLEATDPHLDQLWVQGARDRLEAYRSGELGAQDFASTLSKQRATHSRS